MKTKIKLTCFNSYIFYTIQTKLPEQEITFENVNFKINTFLCSSVYKVQARAFTSSSE